MEHFLSIQALAKRLYRRGPRFQAHLRALRESYHYSPEEWADLQNRQLQRMIRHCYANVPYYRNWFLDNRLAPEDILTVADLTVLPLLDKQTVRENFGKLIDQKRLNPLCRHAETSGTTGTPGRFLRDYNAINFEQATVWRHWQQADATGRRSLTLRGKMVVPMSQANPPFWQHNPLEQELIMCSYHLSPGTSRAYVDKILDFRPEVLYSAPAIAHVLAKFFRLHNVRYRFRAIITSSENLTPEIADDIREVFQAPIFDWYGQAERVAAAATCRYGTIHLLEDYSVVETLETPDGCELVGTQLHNYVMPLLRYRTGDFIIPGRGVCACGNTFRTIARMVGRQNAYLITPEGYRIFNTTHIPFGIENLIETQFFQELPGEVTLRVLTTEAFCDADREALIQRTLQHTSPHMRVRVQPVDHIPRGPNGKFVSILNRLESVAVPTVEPEPADSVERVASVLL